MNVVWWSASKQVSSCKSCHTYTSYVLVVIKCIPIKRSIQDKNRESYLLFVCYELFSIVGYKRQFSFESWFIFNMLYDTNKFSIIMRLLVLLRVSSSNLHSYLGRTWIFKTGRDSWARTPLQLGKSGTFVNKNRRQEMLMWSALFNTRKGHTQFLVQ